MRFLHLTTFYPPYHFGGDAMYIYRLAHALGDAGHSVDVVHCIDAYHLLHPADPPIRFAEHPNVKVHGLKSGYGWLSPFVTQQTGQLGFKAKSIVEQINRENYDVIHYHNISLLGPQVLALAPDRGRPLKLYTTHEHWLICPTHVLWKFNSRACEKPECFRCALVSKKPPQLWRYTSMLKHAGAHVDKFVSPSRFTARMHAERGFPYRVEPLPYFIERSDDDWREPAPRPQARPYFLFVGRLERIKGLDELIQAWQDAGDIDLLVAGEGTYGETLRAMAAHDARIRFLGALSQRELAALYVHALAVVVPSLTVETFGIILIEAFARKTPVIVRDLGALPEVVEDSRGGFVFRNHAELISALQRLACEPALRNELGENGYNAFVRNWSREAHLEMYIGMLRALAMEKLNRVPWEDAAMETRPRVPARLTQPVQA